LKTCNIKSSAIVDSVSLGFFLLVKNRHVSFAHKLSWRMKLPHSLIFLKVSRTTYIFTASWILSVCLRTLN